MKLTSRVSFFKCFLISDVVPSSSSDLTSFLVVFLDSSSSFTFLNSLSSFSVDAGRFKAPPLSKKKRNLSEKKEDFFISHIESRSRSRMLIGNFKNQRFSRRNDRFINTSWKLNGKIQINK